MAKVKIQTAIHTNFGRGVDFNGTIVKFDKLGIAEVEQEVVHLLVETYSGWLSLVGQNKTKETSENETQVKVDETSQLEITRLTERIEAREATIEALTNECTEWKNQTVSYKTKSEKLEKELTGYKTQVGKQIEELKLQVELTNKTTKELIEFCRSLEIPEERFKDANKQSLITIILDESRIK